MKIILETLGRLFTNKSFCCNAPLEERINGKFYCSECGKKDDSRI